MTLSNSQAYIRWLHMMDRCYNDQCPAYPDYGGRGIKVCDRWHRFDNYKADLPPGYFKGAQLDRMDNDGDYEPSNIRWSTARANNNNRRSTVQITHAGRTQSMTEWARELGVPVQTIWCRINVEKWSIEDAVTKPPTDFRECMARARALRWKDHVKSSPPTPRILKTVEYKGEVITLKQLSEKSGVPQPLLRKRILERGWSVEKAVLPDQRRKITRGW